MKTRQHYSPLGQAIIGGVMTGMLFFCLPDAHSLQSTTEDPVLINRLVKRISQSQIKAIMESEGYSVSIDDNDILVWRLEGYRTILLVSDDEESLQFHASFGGVNATFETVNDWNWTKRFSRTYLDKDGDPHLELDLDLAGGITQDRIVDFLKTCRVSFVAWLAEVVE